MNTPQWIDINERRPTEADADCSGMIIQLLECRESIVYNWDDVDGTTHWMPIPPPPKPSPIAPGHNPDKLTCAQVETDKGWRLFEAEELGIYRDLTLEIQAFMRGAWDTNSWAGDCGDFTYRTQKPPGYFLPKPAAKEEPANPLDAPATKRDVLEAIKAMFREMEQVEYRDRCFDAVERSLSASPSKPSRSP
jgi:hypothetical protein